MGETDQAIKWVETARNKESEGAFFNLSYLLHDPMLENLKGDPRFQLIVENKIQDIEDSRRVFIRKIKEKYANGEFRWAFQ